MRGAKNKFELEINNIKKSRAQRSGPILLVFLKKMFVIDDIFVGISRLRAVVLYELQAALSAYSRKKYLSGEISQTHLKNIYKVRTFRKKYSLFH